MNIRLVNGNDPKIACALRWLQLEILPSDEPCDTSSGFWWISYDNDLPIGFAGLSQSVRWCDAGYLSRAGVIRSQRGKGIQKRLIRARERKAREIGWRWLITDTRNNPASANSLIACSYRLFIPSKPWGHTDAIYWRKAIK